MYKTIARCTSLLVVIGVSAFAASKAVADGPKKMLSHDVYFQLKDDSPAKQEELVVGCKKFLSEHEGVVMFSAGRIVAELDRDVNDQDFQVALHIVFANKAAHDAYQEAPKHLKFIEEYSYNWESARVFDSWIEAFVHPKAKDHDEDEDEDEDEDDEREHGRRRTRLTLPEGGAGFAGLLLVEVEGKHEGRMLVEVEEVLKVWKSNKAEKPYAIEKDKIVITAGENANAAALSRMLEEDDELTLDVQHVDGPLFRILELTAEQREMIGK